MWLTKVEIEGLFHKYNYVIPLNTDERITIIHGINGAGKTTILKLINDFFSTNYFEIQRIPYHIIRFIFNDSSQINIYKTFFFLASQCLNDKKYDSFLTDEYIYKDKRLFFEFISSNLKMNDIRIFSFDGDSFNEYKNSQSPLDPNKILEIKDRIKKDIQNFDFLLRISEDTYYKKIEREKEEEIQELKKKEGDILINISRLKGDIEYTEREQQNLNLQLSKEKKNLIKIFSHLEIVDESEIIDYQREEIQKLENEIVRTNSELKHKKIEFAQLNDIKNKIEHKPLKRKTVKRPIFSKLEEKSLSTRIIVTSRLESQNWLKQLEDFSHVIKNQKSPANKIFVDKFLAYRNIIETFLHEKSVDIHEAGELFLIDKITGNMIYPEQLSSGERHIISIFTNLIFNTPEDCIVLIDEPEISLHISWQIRFIEKLKEVLDLEDRKNIQIIIATHSPEIIYDRWDLTVGLGGNE